MDNSFRIMPYIFFPSSDSGSTFRKFSMNSSMRTESALATALPYLPSRTKSSIASSISDILVGSYSFLSGSSTVTVLAALPATLDFLLVISLRDFFPAAVGCSTMKPSSSLIELNSYLPRSNPDVFFLFLFFLLIMSTS